MHYQADQIIFWPRLIHAAAAVDPVLADALRELMTHGADLRHVFVTGKLQLFPGAMAEADYNRIKEQTLTPRRVKIARLLAEAAGRSHPWLTSVVTAYDGVHKRTELGKKALLAAGSKHDTKAWAAALLALVDRHYQAGLLAQALFNAGYAQYDKPMSEHYEGYMDRWEDARKAEISHIPVTPDAPPRGWPVETPDGWLWVCDMAIWQGKPWEPPPTVGRTWSPGEPLITDHQLAIALARVEDATAQRREAG